MHSIRSTESRSLCRLVAAGLLSLFPVVALAHSPHHIITGIAVEDAPDPEADVFILITDQVFRSVDRDRPWKNLDNGLDIRHPYVSVALSPEYANDETVYVATSGDGVFRSTNAGDDWERFNDGLDDLVLADLLVWQSATGEHRLLAAGSHGGLWSRESGGAEWREVLSPGISVTSLAASATRAGDVFAGDGSGRIWHAADGGRLWHIVAKLEGAGAVTAIAAVGERIFAGTSGDGLYVSNDEGGTFRRLESFSPVRSSDCLGRELDRPVSDTHVTSIGTSPHFASDTTLYATTWYGGVFVSTNGGSAWREWSAGLSCDPQAASEGLPHFSGVEFGDPDDDVVWLASFDGLFRAERHFGRWHQLETLPLGLIKGFAVDTADRGGPVVALATYGGGFYLTKDLGRNWVVGNRGLITTRLTGIAFSPEGSDTSRVYAGASQRLLWSDDDGRRWHRVMLQEYGIGSRIAFKLWSWGVPRRMTRVLHDPREHALVYPTHIVARTYPGTGRVYFATRFHGVMAFDPESGEVESVWSGTDEIMNTFEASPDFDDDGTLIASIRGEGLVLSIDRGVSWQRVNAGLDFVDEWARTPQGTNFRRDVQIAISPGFGTDGVVFAGSPAASGLYLSDDGGSSWQKLDLLPNAPAVPVLAIALSPEFANDGTMLVSVKGHGLHLSTDGGRTFKAVGESLRRANASLEFAAFSDDYAEDRTIISASDEHLFASRDGGENWQTLDRPIRYEDMRDVVRFSPGWVEESGADFSAMTERRSASTGTTVSVDFFGTGVRWLGSVGPGYGGADVFIDGVFIDSVNTHASAYEPLQTLFTIGDLDFGRHILEVRTNADVAIGPVAVDAFDILGGTGAAR